MGSLITGVVRGARSGVVTWREPARPALPKTMAKIRDLLNTRTINYLELIGNGRQYHVPALPAVSSSFMKSVEANGARIGYNELWRVPAILGGSGNAGIEAGHYMGALVVDLEKRPKISNY